MCRQIFRNGESIYASSEGLQTLLVVFDDFDRLHEGVHAQTAAWLKEQTYKGQPLEVAETQSNFILFGGHFDNRDRIFDELLQRGVLIRTVGPDGWMRVCMGTDGEMARFREALVEVLRIVEQD